jgi:hypothetical protein
MATADKTQFTDMIRTGIDNIVSFHFKLPSILYKS